MAGGYPDLIAPVVPDAQKNKAPEIFLQAMGTGLQAAARFAEMRRQSEETVLKIAAQERIAGDEHELAKQKMAEDFELRDRAMTLNEELLPSRKMYYESAANNKRDAAQTLFAYNTQRNQLINEANSDAEALGLNDPRTAVKDPVGFAANSLKFESEWGFGKSTLPEIDAAITRYQRQRDQHKIPLTNVIRDSTGSWKLGDGQQMVPIYRIVQQLQDPNTHDYAVELLRQNGHIQSKEEKSKPYMMGWGNLLHPSEVTVTRDVPDALAADALDKAKSVDFTPGKSKLPAAMQPKSYGKGIAPTELPEPDLPEDGTLPDQSAADQLSSPTETDNFLNQAKGALAQGASVKAVADKLIEMGIDPSQMWA